MSNYYQYMDALVKIAHRLMKMDGWTVYGYHADESDSMTDYYCPAYWEGIATKNGFTLVINQKTAGAERRYTVRTSSDNSGEYSEKIRKLERMTTANGASIAEEETAKAAIKKLLEKQTSEETTKEVYTPGHLANPPRCNWHIERDGVIYDKGTGLLKFSGVPDISGYGYSFEIKDWQEFNNKTKEQWIDSYILDCSSKWNSTTTREAAERVYNDQVEKYNLLEKFNLLIARFNNVCGGSVGNTEEGFYTYEQVKVTKYKKELKPVEIDNGKIQEGQCFILKHSFNYGCNSGYVYRIHETEYTDKKTGEVIVSYHAYRLGKGYKKELTGMSTAANYWHIGTIEKNSLDKWIEKGSIAFCDLEEVDTPYEVTKTVKKHVKPESETQEAEPAQDAQTAPETDETTEGKEDTTTTETATTEATETATEANTETATEATTEEAEPATDEAETTEPKPASNDLFEQLAKAYVNGGSVPAKPKKEKNTTLGGRSDEATTDTEPEQPKSDYNPPEPDPVKDAPGYTGETSSVFSLAELCDLMNGKQVVKNCGYHNDVYIAIKYKTAFIVQRFNVGNQTQIGPSNSSSYYGFIAGGKFYGEENTKALRRSIHEDVNAYIIKAIPTPEAAEENATKNCGEWDLKSVEEYKKFCQKSEAENYFYNDKLPVIDFHEGPQPTETTILEYIMNPAETVKQLAEYKIENNAGHIAKVYMKYNGIVSELRKITEDTGHKAHIIKRIAKSVPEDFKTVRITIANGETVTVDAGGVRRMTSYPHISDYYIKAADRHKLPKNDYNRSKDIEPEDITQIIHGAKVLYKVA